MTQEDIYVGPLSAVDTTIGNAGVSHLISLINDQFMISTPPEIAPDNHLRLAMNDISEPQPGLVPPNQDHVAELIDFAIAWDRRGPMLIHCWAGISRSTAAAFIALCTLNPDQEEDGIARSLRSASPTATPNSRLVALADEILGRDGRMSAAVAAIGRGAFASEGALFKMPALFASSRAETISGE
ncbi:MAG: tyrosine protein phosphatase [Hyphomicrobiales bacterium]|nr:tyrosine protein phosphatase [Hyphomicrobiales bacterium]